MFSFWERRAPARQTYKFKSEKLAQISREQHIFKTGYGTEATRLGVWRENKKYQFVNSNLNMKKGTLIAERFRVLCKLGKGGQSLFGSRYDRK